MAGARDVLNGNDWQTHFRSHADVPHLYTCRQVEDKLSVNILLFFSPLTHLHAGCAVPHQAWQAPPSSPYWRPAQQSACLTTATRLLVVTASRTLLLMACTTSAHLMRSSHAARQKT